MNPKVPQRLAQRKNFVLLRVQLDINCVFYCYMHVFADYVACKWRHSLFAMLIVKKRSEASVVRSLCHS